MMKAGWRPLFHQWLNDTFPRAGSHRALHVGRGGVGSASGAFFVGDEICAHDPDLVFVEYAINDSYPFLTPSTLRLESIEGIVRSIRSRNPNCDICFVYMHHVDRGAEIREVVRAYEKVADHYGLPSIHVGRYLGDLVEGGDWSFRGEAGLPALLRDECHPLESGNRLIAELMAEGILGLLCDSRGGTSALPPNLTAKPLVGGRIVPVDGSMIEGPFQLQRRQVANYGSPVTFCSLPEGSRIRVSPDGELVGVYVVVGPSSGWVAATVGGERVERQLLDRWCHYERISTCILRETRDATDSGKHEAVIELSGRKPDYSVCPQVTTIPERRLLDVVGLFVV